MELARKQIWYRSVALGARRRGLLSWMLQSIFESLNVSSMTVPMAVTDSCDIFALIPFEGGVCARRTLHFRT